MVEWWELMERREKGKTALGESCKFSEFRLLWGTCPHERGLRMASAGGHDWNDRRWWVHTTLEGKGKNRIEGSCHSLPFCDCYLDESLRDCIMHARRNGRGRGWWTGESFGSGQNYHGDRRCLRTSAVGFVPQGNSGPKEGWQKRFREIICNGSFIKVSWGTKYC